MTDPLTMINTRRTAQSEQADPRQVENSAGGFVFALDDRTRLRRFLLLGSSGGTYYVSEQELTKDNAEVVLRMAREDCQTLVDEIVDVSVNGRAPRQNPCLFALAAAAGLGDPVGKRAALDALPLVARIGTHLFIFARYVEQFRGWGPTLRRAVGNWYSDKAVQDLTYQAVKYRQREGWSHRDLLRLSHPQTDDLERKALFDWICGREFQGSEGLRLIEGFQRAQDATDREVVVQLVREHGLTWEMLPDFALNTPAVWEALLERGVPQTALLRQLPRLTRIGLLTQISDWTVQVAKQLTNAERLRKARVHPISVLIALRTYASGHGMRGSGEWKPVRQIVDALDAAFYAAFGAVEPANKRTLIALDVSSSMAESISGLPISCREAAAALALVTAATEDRYEIVGFCSESGTSYKTAWSMGPTISPLAISPRQRLDDVLKTTANLPFGGTDCALPMVDALKRKSEIDTFVEITDNETWAGSIHPHQALRKYREKMGINARLVVVGMTSTGFSVADPLDRGSLDVVGFDVSVPNLISDFSRGDV